MPYDYFRHTYYEMHDTEMYEVKTRDPLPTYPKTLRFKKPEDCKRLVDAYKSFIQSTKIPENCAKCPQNGICRTTFHGARKCRITWRKIWEYTK